MERGKGEAPADKHVGKQSKTSGNKKEATAIDKRAKVSEVEGDSRRITGFTACCGQE